MKVALACVLFLLPCCADGPGSADSDGEATGEGEADDECPITSLEDVEIGELSLSQRSCVAASVCGDEPAPDLECTGIGQEAATVEECVDRVTLAIGTLAADCDDILAGELLIAFQNSPAQNCEELEASEDDSQILSLRCEQ
jgi:hypothetical protein